MYLYSCHSVFIDRFIFRSNFTGMRFPWNRHGQSQEGNWRHYCDWTGTVFHKRKGILKIDQSVKMPWLRLSMGVACSYSSAPVLNCVNSIERRRLFVRNSEFWCVQFSEHLPSTGPCGPWSEGANEATMPSLILSRPFFSDLVGTGSYFRDAIEKFIHRPSYLIPYLIFRIFVMMKLRFLSFC